MNIKQTTLALSMLAVFGLSAGHAATMTWGAATTIGGASDVSTNGTLVNAYNFGKALDPGKVTAATINGVTFEATAITSPTTLTNLSVTGISGSNVFTDNTGAYETGLTQGAFGSSGSIVLGGLTAGVEYEVQVWANDGRQNTADERFTTLDGGAVSLSQGMSNVGNGLGQFAIASFTADATSQTISFSNRSGGVLISGGATVSMLQVRAIPEPNAFGLVAVAGIAAVFMRRRSRKA